MVLCVILFLVDAHVLDSEVFNKMCLGSIILCGVPVFVNWCFMHQRVDSARTHGKGQFYAPGDKRLLHGCCCMLPFWVGGYQQGETSSLSVIQNLHFCIWTNYGAVMKTTCTSCWGDCKYAWYWRLSCQKFNNFSYAQGAKNMQIQSFEARKWEEIDHLISNHVSFICPKPIGWQD